MIIAIKAFQDKGKTSWMVALVKELLRIGALFGPDGFHYSDVVANLLLPNWPGSHSITNHQMRLYVKAMVSKGLKHKIVMMDEADRLFPARFWHNPEQTEALIGLWQDYKLFNVIVYTAHEGTSTDVILREVTQIEITPEYDEYDDCIYFVVYNAIDGIVYDDVIDNISEIFKDYDRWELVV